MRRQKKIWESENKKTMDPANGGTGKKRHYGGKTRQKN